MDPESTLTIGQLAEKTGFKASAIRYYESIGVLPRPSRESGQRRYDSQMVERLGMFDAAQQAGFSLEEIGSLFRSSDQGQVSTELRDLASSRLGDVTQLIERAQRMKVWLEQATDCGCATLEDCSLFTDQATRVGNDPVLKVIGRNQREGPEAG